MRQDTFCIKILCLKKSHFIIGDEILHFGLFFFVFVEVVYECVCLCLCVYTECLSIETANLKALTKFNSLTKNTMSSTYLQFDSQFTSQLENIHPNFQQDYFSKLCICLCFLKYRCSVSRTVKVAWTMYHLLQVCICCLFNPNNPFRIFLSPYSLLIPGYPWNQLYIRNCKFWLMELINRLHHHIMTWRNNLLP